MGKHPDYVEGFNGSLEELAKAVGKMSYDAASSFLEKLAEDLKKQADSDLARGRTKLAKEMYQAVEYLQEAKKYINKSWKICEPYTEKYSKNE